MEMEKSQQPRRCQDQEKSQEIRRLPELDVYAFSDDDLDLQGTLVRGLLHEESAQEHHENLPIMECQDLPIPHSSSRLRSMRKTGSDKASRIVQTEKMVETYLQRRRHNKKMSPCKFNVGMIVEALEEDGFWYKAKVLSVQKEKMKIHWTGYNYDEWQSASKIRLELKKGDEVEAPWLVHRADRYPGHVERIDGEYVHIAFNDQTN
ncbi:uncharacterized protein LOC124126670 isoform X2 [Haliotis rufescens]|uniref:uncharacterized protein LOC124126670 isoform X2 n=1 Tax=Haliotis rufescens TaxID=6454 RepID=UPI00201EFFC5|nr:uncharacterized protein LOC124126670 isoform X2 [Haliotis rufescens]